MEKVEKGTVSSLDAGGGRGKGLGKKRKSICSPPKGGIGCKFRSVFVFGEGLSIFCVVFLLGGRGWSVFLFFGKGFLGSFNTSM